MATVTHKVNLSSTSNVETYTTGAFTPAVGDLLAVCATISGSTQVPLITTSTGLSFSILVSADKAVGADWVYIAVADALVASAVSMTVMVDVIGDAATGINITVLSVAGMAKTGTAAKKKASSKSSASAGTTPAVTFAGAVDTANAVIGLVGNASNPATITPPSSFTENADIGFSSPNCGQEVVSINSGFTGTTLTWGSTSVSGYAVVAVELDTSSNAVTGTLAATETGGDTSAFTGTVLVKGALTVSETGKDTASFPGDVFVQGTLTASESGPDTFAASGTVPTPPATITGTLSVQETGSDTASLQGKVLVKGALTVSESGSDTAALAGKVAVKGTLTATETGSDTVSISGVVVPVGTNLYFGGVAISKVYLGGVEITHAYQGATKIF